MGLKYKTGEEVSLVIIRETDLGFVAKINDCDEGLLYRNQIFKEIKIKQELKGYIKKVREGGGIDLSLQNFGHLGSKELAEEIVKALRLCKGYLPLNAKSSADRVHDFFGVSRKKFKMALGFLYKERRVEFTDEGTKLVDHS